MSKIRVSTLIRAPRPVVWHAVRDVASHVRWMHDADRIRITSPRATGVGTTFVCDTRVGPFRLSDAMEVIEWRERRSMGIRHTGLVRGVGRFTLRTRPGGTLFTWEERLRLPSWMGGRLGAIVAKPVLRRIWKRNLATLKRMVESG
jgi:uncharacterized protein YndB with AHSA1/START domain